ncbi:hypothetical protein O181_011138 [Austropuccinia psidii MF-1]|uniref:Cell cycle checkpoint protein RAD17 n=1 Tax=Austropuccinia psidii MF-1 TaxID=1389203 RepID=A0A9Q3BUA5_9BASI|nr:hypothetical protein [Austropuccinia psidii MF-1]
MSSSATSSNLSQSFQKRKFQSEVNLIDSSKFKPNKILKPLSTHNFFPSNFKPTLKKSATNLNHSNLSLIHSKSTSKPRNHNLKSSSAEFVAMKNPTQPITLPSSSSTIKLFQSIDHSSHKINSNQSNLSSKTNVSDQGLTSEPNEIWSNIYRPIHSSQLAVHPKKLELIQSWLNDALKGSSNIRNYRRILVLGGPAGSGKSTIIHTLSQNLPNLSTNPSYYSSQSKTEPSSQAAGYEILEWSNSGIESDHSKLTAFPLWLKRASFSPTLSFSNDNQDFNHSTLTGCKKKTNNSKLLLVDDLPNLSHGETLRMFCDALRYHLNSPQNSTPPLVVLISDTTVRHGENGLGDVLAGHQTRVFHSGRNSNLDDRGISTHIILPSDILQHPACCYVKLNAVSKALMRKLLNAVVDKIPYLKTWKPSQKHIEMIIQASGGDIRAALNNLQLLHSNSDLALSLSQQKKNTLSEKAPGCSQSFLTYRDDSLAIFHSLGKVLFNKRWGDDLVDDSKDKRLRLPTPDDVPPFLQTFSRKQLKTDVDGLYSEMSVPVDRLIPYLHENYVPFTNQVEETSQVVEYLSLTDSTASLNHTGWARGPLSEFYQFQICIRGILLALPSPVSRRSQKFYKPVMWDHNREYLKNSQGLDLVRDEWLMKSNWQSQKQFGLEDDEPIQELCVCSSLRNLSKKSLATEVIPFLGLLHQVQHPASSNLKTFLRQICTFKYPKLKNGVRDGQILSEDDDEDNNDGDHDDWELQSESNRFNHPSSQVNITPVAQETDELNWFEKEDDIEEF